MDTETHRAGHQDRNLGKSSFCYIDPEFSKTAVETFLFYARHIILLVDNTATLSTGSSSVDLTTEWITLVKSISCPSLLTGLSL